MTVTTTMTYARARALGQNLFRLTITGWGNQGTGADANSLIYPATGNRDQAVGSIYGAAIGPGSTVDHVSIRYDGLFPIVVTPDTPAVFFTEVVSKDRPAGQLPGPLLISTDLISGSVYADGYFKALSNVLQPFGGTQPLFEPPLLELDLYLKPVISPSPTKRNPMFRTINITANPDGAEHLIGIFPVFGRKGLNAQFRAYDNGGGGNIAASIRLGSITYAESDILQQNTEVTIASLTVDSATGKTCALISGNLSQYVAVYYTVSAGAAGCFIRGQLLADDDGTCCASLGS